MTRPIGPVRSQQIAICWTTWLVGAAKTILKNMKVSWDDFPYILSWLLVGGFNPSEKYYIVNGKDDIPCIMENKTRSKPPDDHLAMDWPWMPHVQTQIQKPVRKILAVRSPWISPDSRLSPQIFLVNSAYHTCFFPNSQNPMQFLCKEMYFFRGTKGTATMDAMCHIQKLVVRSGYPCHKYGIMALAGQSRVQQNRLSTAGCSSRHLTC